MGESHIIIHESERLKLKLFDSEDLQAVKSFWGDSEVMAYCGGASPEEVLPKVLQLYGECHDVKGLSVYAVVEKASGNVIGAAGFNVVHGLERIELIYHFAKSSWGKGYATEAAIACMDLAKKRQEVRTVYASADSKNINSTNILKKAGFKFIEMKWFDDTKQEEPYFEYQFPT